MNLYNLLNGEITQEEYLNYHNITVKYKYFPYNKIRGFVENYRGINFIYINKNLSYYKKRKTLLHELAHIELNQLNQIDNDLFAFHIDKYEDEADKYIKFILESIRSES